MKTLEERIQRRANELGLPTYHVGDSTGIQRWLTLLPRWQWQLLLWAVASPFQVLACWLLWQWYPPIAGLVGPPIGLLPSASILSKLEFGSWRFWR